MITSKPFIIHHSPRGFILPLVIVAMVILSILSIGAMMVSYTARLQAVGVKAQTEAMLAAEAGYERAIFWMSQQTDILGAIQTAGGSGTIDFGTSSCNYSVGFSGYVGARPVFKVNATGKSGRPTFYRVVDVNVVQETSGWAEALCRIPSGTTDTTEVYFKNGEIIDMPIHINNYNDNPDQRDIWISSSGGNPRFLQKVEMGEPRYTSGGSDKYSSVMTLFDGGIYFDQPGVHITDAAAIQSKITRFRDSTAAAYRFTPAGTANFGSGTTKYDAVQLEFFVDGGGVGRVRITNNCSVKGRDPGSYDYKVVNGSGGDTFEKYKIYDYHCRPNGGTQTIISIDGNSSPCYVRQTFPGGYESALGGQIYVKGSVVIGSDTYTDMVVKGKITVVAERKDDGTGGHIWIADSIKVAGSHDADGKPSANNENVLGLIAQGVIKVVSPTSSGSPSVSGQTYQPIGITKSGCSSGRFMPDPTVVEAAITVGGGGWGAEDVGDRREYSGVCDGSGSHHDDLVVRGSITEVVRGVVGLFNSSGVTVEGYSKYYYSDTRLMSGILPGDIWFSGKFIPAPAGWHDRSAN